MSPENKQELTLETLLQRAQQWLEFDPDLHTASQIRTMIEKQDYDVLKRHFGRYLQFGTAGIRGVLGPGPGCMNRLLVQRVSYGVGIYLRSLNGPSTIVVGFDGRHGSSRFAEDTACVLGSMGHTVYVHDTTTPTPELAYAVLHMGAELGIMVTASHNPPGDNGYKVYWNNGAQIIPPHDANIIDAMMNVEWRRVSLESVEALRQSKRIQSVPSHVGDAYVREVLRLAPRIRRDLKVVYTPLHGVAYERLHQVLTSAGFEDVHVVPEQREPDPDFRTVQFPNPEHPGALKMAKSLATTLDADLVIANDPDGDRLAVCVRMNGDWLQLTGNEIGVLLAEDQLSRAVCERPMVATTIVSTPLLREIAQSFGAAYRETLTGFKWIANAGIDHEKEGGTFLFGFEEALGYTIGRTVRDKDGISAALCLCALAERDRLEGRTLIDRLQDIYRRYGFFVSSQVAKSFDGLDGAETMNAVMSGLRIRAPRHFSEKELSEIRDGIKQSRFNVVEGTLEKWDIPKSNVLCWVYEDGTTLLVRPSGTEPKIKVYGYVRKTLGDGELLKDVQLGGLREVQTWLQAVVEQFRS